MSTDRTAREDRNGGADQNASQQPGVTETVSRRLDLGRQREATPKSIGPYKILEPLGEGGMGVVYLAEQTEPIRRRVALKVIKLGMDTKRVIARFETERQALAVMDHPGVAKVFDAGTTDEGRPFFAMEHVPGIPITEHCDRHKLNIEERLHLFTHLCEAVQHAHQKGVIHRDIKPTNILVSVKDELPHPPLGKGGPGGVPKVIDFGVAKAISQPLTERTLFTEQGQLIGTPAYMSPEQAEMTAQDIDTRTDIYSLGVLLYELLTGEPPLNPKSLHEAAFERVLHMIREFEPPKPSTKLSGLMGADDDTSMATARDRRTTPGTLTAHLRGDLDWITMKAMEKDRTRRYATATDFAADLHRHLNHEPVLACPPGTAYRVKKFVRRNRGFVTAAAVVFVVLLLGIAGTTWQAVVATRQRDRAVRAEQQQSRERERAEAARNDSDAVVKFLSDMLAAVQPEEHGRNVTVRQILDEAAQTIGEKFRDKPLIEARLRQTIGVTYVALGVYDDAELHAGAAARIFRHELGPRHDDTLVSTHNLAVTLQRQGKFSGAAESLRKTYEIQRRVLGEEHPRTLNSMNYLTVALREQGKYAEAEKLYRKTLEIQRRRLGEEHADTLTSRHNLASALFGQGKYAEAETLDRKTLEIMRRVLGEEHPNTLYPMGNLAVTLDAQGRYAEAERLYRDTLEIRRRVLGEEHPETLRSMSNLAQALGDLGKLTEAETSLRQTVAIMRRVLGNEHPLLVDALVGLAEVLLRKGEPEDARGLVLEALTIRQAALREDHSDLAIARSVLGECLAALGRYDEAESLVPESYDRLKAAQGESGVEAIKALKRIVKLYEAWDVAEPGKGYAEKAAKWRRGLPVSQPGTNPGTEATREPSDGGGP